jgi:hypothetical protein
MRALAASREIAATLLLWMRDVCQMPLRGFATIRNPPVPFRERISRW